MSPRPNEPTGGAAALHKLLALLMTTRSHLLGLTAAAILVAPAAQAASVKEIFEKYNLLGYWAVDCSKPASNSNLFYVNRILGTDAVQRDGMVGEGKRSSLAIIDAAIAVGRCFFAAAR
jgi:hypothetical protein